MACNGSSCQSNCNADDEVPEELKLQTSNGEPVHTHPILVNNDSDNLCIKCKLNPSVSGYGGVEDGRICGDCFKSNLFGKFRMAVTSNAMITPTDNVLVAFSGGSSSRVALQFVHDMQSRALKNFEASRDKSLPVFGVGVVFVDERAASIIPSREIDTVIKEIELIVSNLSPPKKDLHVFPIEGVYSDVSDGRSEKMKKLVDAVTDPTGKEDFLLHLRMLALQKVASENGYNRLVLGSCTSRLACHVISATVKGQGYSLPADIQYVDSRWKIPVVLPLRDCLAQEINMLCHLDGLKTTDLSNGPCSGINGYVSSFVKLLQEENPSRECTIVRTAGKLIPFHFNRIPVITDTGVPMATRRRQKRYNHKTTETISSEYFCPICYSPLNKSDMIGSGNLENGLASADMFSAIFCSSCHFQILPEEPSSLEQFFSILPQQMVARAKQGSHGDLNFLREQIQDCLLSDSEDET